MQPLIKKAVIAIIVLATAAAAAGWYLNPRSQATMAYRTTRVTRGNLLVAISATGTVEPEEVIDVGAQVAGNTAPPGGHSPAFVLLAPVPHIVPISFGRHR